MGPFQETVGILGEKKISDTVGVYVHIPYCLSKCPYCDFKSVVLKELPEESYAGCVLTELSSLLRKEEALSGKPLESVYIGGGTPSLFSPLTISRIIRSIRSSFAPFKNEIEITLEVNPDGAEPERLKGYREAGVNRLSIGVQSLSDAELRNLGRTHSAGKALASVAAAREAGFTNTGVDLIYGAPGQSVDSFRASLEKVVNLRPEHVSLYNLTLEEGTPFHRTYAVEKDPEAVPLAPEEDELRMYAEAVEALKAAGYLHYEISNWAIPGFEGVHNSRYWTGEAYLGLGSSAHSYLNAPGWGRRWWNESDPELYMRRIGSAGEAVTGVETLGRDEALTEALFLGLRRLGKGIEAASFRARFGLDPKEAFPASKAFEKEGLLVFRGEDLLLTPKGVLVSNEVFLRLRG